MGWYLVNSMAARLEGARAEAALLGGSTALQPRRAVGGLVRVRVRVRVGVRACAR